MLKRFIPMLLCLLLIAGLFSGCELPFGNDPDANHTDETGSGYRLLMKQSTPFAEAYREREVYYYNKDNTVSKIEYFSTEKTSSSFETAAWEKEYTTYYTYDAQGRMLSSKRDDGVEEHSYSYENTEGCYCVTDSVTTILDHSVDKSFFDSDGRLLQMTHTVGEYNEETIYSYTDNGKLLTKKMVTSLGEIQLESYEYHSDGSYTRTEKKGNDNDSSDLLLSHFDEYDKYDNLVLSITYIDGQVSSTTEHIYKYTFAANGSISSYIRYDSAERKEEKVEFDSDGHITKQQYFSSSDGKESFYKTYEYNNHGDLIRYQDKNGALEEYIYSEE